MAECFWSVLFLFALSQLTSYYYFFVVLLMLWQLPNIFRQREIWFAFSMCLATHLHKIPLRVVHSAWFVSARMIQRFIFHYSSTFLTFDKEFQNKVKTKTH